MRATTGKISVEFFIARRLFREKENRHHLSRKIIRIAVAGISLGIMLMLLSVTIVTGFKKEISDKVVGFGSHIQVVNYDSNLSFETAPVNSVQPFLPRLSTMDNIGSVHVFATKPGIIKTGENIQGVVLKGVDAAYDWSFFRKHLIQGTLPDLKGERSPEVLISENLCSMLFLKQGDPLYLFFINENEKTPRIRQFRISGIYRTNLQEFDDIYILGDLRQIQHINNWDSTQVSGFEIKLKDFRKLDESFNQITGQVISYNREPGSTLHTLTIRQKYPQIFDWLTILDMNVWVILTLMVLVSGFNMVSALLVLILERSRMIGTLKALGSQNKTIRKIFLYLSGFLISRGLFWGNLAGLVLIFIQKYFRLIRLDATSYYMDYVPVHPNLWHILLLNAGAMLITLLMMLVPGYFISRISPDKTLRFD